MAEIAATLRRRKLTQIEAAAVLGITQPRLSNLLRGRFRGISEAKMMACLTRLGRDVEIVVRPKKRGKAAGHVTVVAA